MNPTALNRPASFVEEKIGTLIKTFQRTISDEVGNAGPEHCRTKKALVLSMRTIQSLLRCAHLWHFDFYILVALSLQEVLKVMTLLFAEIHRQSSAL